MKRSEMVLKMAGVIADYSGRLEPTRNDMFMASDLLRKIEEQGMVPPIIEDKSWTMLPNGEMVYAVHEWEEE